MQSFAERGVVFRDQDLEELGGLSSCFVPTAVVRTFFGDYGMGRCEPCFVCQQISTGIWG